MDQVALFIWTLSPIWCNRYETSGIYIYLEKRWKEILRSDLSITPTGNCCRSWLVVSTVIGGGRTFGARNQNHKNNFYFCEGQTVCMSN